MKRYPEIEITDEDVEILLEEEYPFFQTIIESGIHCVRCNNKYSGRIVDYHIILNDLNDIILKGKCGECGSDVRRYLEYGEKEHFNQRAIALREALDNLKNMKI
jgi:hypothetical protein